MIKDSLDRPKVVATIERLCLRIDERFPDAGLGQVGRELLAVSQCIDQDLEYIVRPNWWLRGSLVTFILLVSAVLVYGIATTELGHERLTLADLIQIAEAGINDIVLIGAAALFLVSLENRRKRARVIEAVNRLRSIAHVIDMHQLTKDPSVLALPGRSTASSPERRMSPQDLGRYLDYCSELLALTSKVAFCYVQDFDDPQSVNAVNELESLTSGLSRKVWQKIMLLQRELAEA